MSPDLKAPDAPTEAQPGPLAAAPPWAPLCKSQDLLQGGRLYIEHQGQLYCLRLTKAGRLLLTK